MKTLLRKETNLWSIKAVHRDDHLFSSVQRN